MCDIRRVYEIIMSTAQHKLILRQEKASILLVVSAIWIVMTTYFDSLSTIIGIDIEHHS